MQAPGGTSSPCSDSTDYDIVSIGPNTMSYRTRGVGTLYDHARVADDFRLPDTTCGSAPPRRAK